MPTPLQKAPVMALGLMMNVVFSKVGQKDCPGMDHAGYRYGTENGSRIQSYR